MPTLDAEPYLGRLLPALAAQELEGGFELRAVDSSSTDCTRPLLRRAGFTVECIERDAFHHGRTRNRLARGARGEFLVFLTQDALPVREDFLARILEPFTDPEVAGVVARVLPHPSDDPLTARTVLSAPEASDAAVSVPFNNVASAIRRSVFEAMPFPDVPFGEDSAWAAEALEAGWKVTFAPRSVVYHAHRYAPGQAFERYRVDAAFRWRVHGERVRPSLASVARGVLYELREDLRFVRRERKGLHHLLRAPGLRVAQVVGQYFGSRGWNPGGGNAATRRFG